MATNVLGPALLTKELYPRLRQTPKETKAGAPPSKVVAIGAGVGSVSGNAAGGWYSYRVSKTALNALIKNIAIEGGRGHNILAACMYPEMVETELSSPYVKGNPYATLRTPDETAVRMLELVDQMTPEQSGAFVNLWTGEAIPY